MLLWPGTPGEFMSYLPITVIIVLSASLLTAMIFLPVIGSLVGKTEADIQAAENARQLSGSGHVNYNNITGLSGVYVRFLQKLIRRPSLVIITSIAIVFGVFHLFQEHNNGVEFFVDTEPEQALYSSRLEGICQQKKN